VDWAYSFCNFVLLVSDVILLLASVSFSYHFFFSNTLSFFVLDIELDGKPSGELAKGITAKKGAQGDQLASTPTLGL